MNIKTKLILGIGMLAGMIILLVTLSVVNLQILTATEPDSPAAMPGLERALLWISVTGGICILTGLILLYWLPRSISKPIKELKEGILEIANHNYEKRLDMSDNEEFREVADSFNRMAERLTEYRASTLSDILSAKKFIEAIVNSINDPIIGLNTEREVLFINDEALSILNMKRENVIRKSAEELSLKNDLLRRLIRELVTPSDQKEALKIYADNKESYFKVSYVPIINTEAEKGEPRKLGDVILLKNITEFKELDSAKTTFISTISHELKTPITSIRGYVELLESGMALNEETTHDFLKRIKKEAMRMTSLVDDILMISRLESRGAKTEIVTIQVADLLEETVSSLATQAAERGVVIHKQFESFAIRADLRQMNELCMNLIGNAVKYNNTDGEIWVEARRENTDFVLTVRDSGVGIPQESLNRIFERFYRVDKGRSRKQGGTGLGLAIVKHVVNYYHGTVRVESEIGKGSTFTVRLPVAVQP